MSYCLHPSHPLISLHQKNITYIADISYSVSRVQLCNVFPTLFFILPTNENLPPINNITYIDMTTLVGLVDDRYHWNSNTLSPASQRNSRPWAGVEVEGRWPSKCSSHDIRPKHAHNPLSAPLYDIDVLDYVAIEPWCWYGAGGGCHGYDHDLVVCCSSNS
jgi:hypothetical protein